MRPRLYEIQKREQSPPGVADYLERFDAKLFDDARDIVDLIAPGDFVLGLGARTSSAALVVEDEPVSLS
jgi:hypothetical protein